MECPDKHLGWCNHLHGHFMQLCIMPHIDYLIVGQGLAGTCLALELMTRHVSVLILDKPDVNSASRVAAGLFNPVTGKTMQATWKADALFPFLLKWYATAETHLNARFVHPLPILRPFISEEERSQWLNKEQAFVVGSKPVDSTVAHAPWGALQLSHSGFLETHQFLDTAKEFFLKRGSWRDTPFQHSQLDVEHNVYDDVTFTNLIFCEGTSANENPFFQWLPIRKLKGETLLIDIELPADVIFNRGVYAVPTLAKNVFKVGSTYTHDASAGNTDVGLKELHEKTNKLFNKPYKTLQTAWGHRPTSPDRRPMLGRHPKHGNLFVFNGLGTKGVSLAPFFAVHLAQHLVDKTDLDPAVNIERFFSLYFQSQ
jgi:glycine oxidase